MCFLMVMVLLQLKVAKCDICSFFSNLAISISVLLCDGECPKRQ